MTHVTFPKPAKRPRKPKKPLPRSKGFINRGSMPARVSKSAARQEELAADAKWSKAVRAKGRACINIPPQSEYFHVCEGRLESAHIHSRRFAATRHLSLNGLSICHWFHATMTSRQKDWEAFCRAYIGDEKYEALRQKALAGPKALKP